MAEVKITVTVEDKASGTINTIVKSTDTAAGQTRSIFDGLKRHWLAVTGAIVSAWKTVQTTLDMAILSARVETLGVVMAVVGRNAGYSKKEVEGYAESIRSMGITTQQSRQSVIMMAQAQLDLSKASELARVAQDAAVIGNVNSSEALQRLIYGIQSAQPEMLRTIGINVNFENAYARAAIQMKRNTQSLSEQEKAQIRMNVVLEKGKDIHGAYEAAMGTVGKQLTSLPRYIEEVKLKLGDMLSPALMVLVVEFTESLKLIDKQLGSMSKSGVASQWAYELATSARDAIAFITALSMRLDRLGAALTDIGYFVSLGMGNLGMAKTMKEWNETFEKRYQETERYLEDLGNRAIQTAADLGKESQAAGDKVAAMAQAKKNLANRTENARQALESQKKTLKDMYQALASDFARAADDLAKKQQDLFNVKFTTGDLVSQVKQTLMDPVEKYNEQVQQLMAKEKLALTLNSDEKIRLLQSVQQQWANMTGEIKKEDTVWKTAEETASEAIGNIQRVGRVLEKEKGKQIEETQSLLEQLRTEYDKLKEMENDVLTLKINT